ncbi:MAG: hypothetical protein AAFX79_12530 [Planctomycetota bacterium]
MLHPAPTTRIDRRLARGVLEEVVSATATKPEFARIGFPNTSYVLHLLPDGDIAAKPGGRILGRIHAHVRRVDPVDAGGRYVEPVFGRPRRIQGTVVAHEGGRIVVDAGVAFHCTLADERQRASDFAIGDMITCAVRDGASFAEEPAGEHRGEPNASAAG